MKKSTNVFSLLDEVEDVKDIQLFGNPTVNHIKNEVDDFGDEINNRPRFVPAPGQKKIHPSRDQSPIDALKNLKKEEEWEKEKESYPKRHRNMERITVGPFPQGSVDVQNIDDKTGIQYEKANRRIKKDKRSKLPRAHGQKLQQQKKISKDQQCQL
ncbi:unnamed protein product [Caenorhabditis nigoni]